MKNSYYLLRHGESFSNVKEIVSCWPEKHLLPLTEKGKKQVKESLKKVEKIDLIFSSDILRTFQTSKIAEEELKVKPVYEEKLREYNVGFLNGKSIKKLNEFFEKEEERFVKKPKGGETYNNLFKRSKSFLESLEEKYSNKNILIISHQINLTFLEGILKGINKKEILKNNKRIKKGELKKVL